MLDQFEEFHIGSFDAINCKPFITVRDRLPLHAHLETQFNTHSGIIFLHFTKDGHTFQERFLFVDTDLKVELMYSPMTRSTT